MKKFLLMSVCMVVILFSSCDLILDIILGNEGSTDPAYGNFWAKNFKTDKDYRVDADLLAKGVYCNVYVEKDSGVNAARAKEVAAHYDTKIYPEMIKNFSVKDISYKLLGETYKFNNIMDFADWYVDEDGKLTILLLDIKDGYNGITETSYTAGYFWLGDFFKREDSNERDMIYIDIKPGMDSKNISETYKTLAHEMQHLMNFATSLLLRAPKNANGQITALSYMDTWIDEGLSAAAEWVYSGEHSTDRVAWYNLNGGGNGLINKGNTFFVWGNRSSEVRTAVLDDYATVYLFFQWLRLQTSSDIYRDIITGQNNNYTAVTSAFNKAVSPGYSWDELLKTWLAANYINSPTGRYGYMNDSVLKNVRVPSSSTAISANISLAQGEGVYSLMGVSPVMPAPTTNIKYASLAKNPATVDNNAANGRVLLTYNVNTTLERDSNSNYISISNSGTTTGIPIPAANISADGRSALSAINGPHRVSGWDMIKRNQISDKQLKAVNLNKGIISDE